MNTVMRTLGGALGGQLSATFIAGHTADGLPTVTGFTETFLMATGFLLICLLAGSSYRRPGRGRGGIFIPGGRSGEIPAPRARRRDRAVFDELIPTGRATPDGVLAAATIALERDLHSLSCSSVLP